MIFMFGLALLVFGSPVIAFWMTVEYLTSD